MDTVRIHFSLGKALLANGQLREGQAACVEAFGLLKDRYSDEHYEVKKWAKELAGQPF